MRLGIFIVAFYAYVMIAPVLGVIIASIGLLSFIFMLRTLLLVPDTYEATQWELAMVGLIFVDSLLLAGGLYESQSWVDIPMHIAGGIFAAWWGALIFLQERDGISFMKQLLLIVAMGALIGVAWECLEWLFDHTLGAWEHLPKAQPSNTDTVSDLFNDVAGAFLIAVLLIKKNTRKPAAE